MDARQCDIRINMPVNAYRYRYEGVETHPEGGNGDVDVGGTWCLCGVSVAFVSFVSVHGEHYIGSGLVRDLPFKDPSRYNRGEGWKVFA
jgi:hypothetical protein